MLFLIFFFVLDFVAAREIASIYVPPAADKCKLGKEWVIDFIKFKCFQLNKDGGITKGIRAIGCVPDNHQDGKVILNGTTWTDSHFTYLCNKTKLETGSVITFKPINCLDSNLKVLKAGENRKMEDGSTYKCFFDKEMDVHLSIDGSNPGCVEGVGIYKERATWMRYRPIEVEISKGKSMQIGVGVATTCLKDADGKYYAKEYGCITADNHRVEPDGYGVVDKQVVKCVKGRDEKLHFELANEDLVSCKVNGKRVTAETEWDDVEKKERLLCHYGKIIKAGCLVENEFIPVNEFRYIKGTGYQCGEKIGESSVNFGNLKGCTLFNGTLVEFFHEFDTEDRVNLCRFRVDNGVVSAFVQQIYCLYRGNRLAFGETQAIGKEVIKCELKGNEYIARKLSEIEMKAWKEKAERAGFISADFEAVDGEGQGQYIRETTKAPTTATIKKVDCKDHLDEQICTRLSLICREKGKLDEIGEIMQILEINKVEKKAQERVHQLIKGKMERIPFDNMTAT
ncbi:unnamed protein product, partial [Mesorhabditis belari]|uniref:Abnormal cell migration protein 18-like fibronectin type I domain-containing protein n=1 Tax=Mesorhabditis belari TaxID=2138241 RepID=A0AAF3F132_9BILA